jgi:hypothetical protein
VGYESPRKPKHPRVSLQRAVSKLWQSTIESTRKVVADLANLFLCDEKIIEQPFIRRCDVALLANSLLDASVGIEERSAIVFQASIKSPATFWTRRDALRRRQAFGVLLETLDAEKFGAN